MNDNFIALLRLLLGRKLYALDHEGKNLIVEIIDIHMDGTCDVQTLYASVVVRRVPAVALKQYSGWRQDHEGAKP